MANKDLLVAYSNYFREESPYHFTSTPDGKQTILAADHRRSYQDQRSFCSTSLEDVLRHMYSQLKEGAEIFVIYDKVQHYLIPLIPKNETINYVFSPLVEIAWSSSDPPNTTVKIEDGKVILDFKDVKQDARLFLHQPRVQDFLNSSPVCLAVWKAALELARAK